ncbi:hypothetical protein ACFPM3_11285 [Streptomyces coeruleoprunus]|uniref:Uncharacterized protein n=1 Tax=Streptomyces coeruleoprunus TaxID=285563 RepID=A0ABV9XB83_9ACTN
MATRLVTCYVAVCDLCGGTGDIDGVIPHFDTPEEVVDCLTADDYAGWTLTPDGVLVCDGRTDAAHEDAHAAAGKRMGPDAMTITFTHA